MLDAVLNGFDVPEHHGGRRVQSESVRCLHHVEPLLAGAFERRDAVAHLVHEYFAATARYRPQPGMLELPDDFGHRHFEYFREMTKLWWREAVDVHLRKVGADVMQQVEIVIDAQLRMVPAL